MSGERWQTLYGDIEGRWAMMAAPLGLTGPATISVGEHPGRLHQLTMLGSPSDVLTRIHNRHRGGRRPVQQALADLIGVAQQALSYYITGAGEPELATIDWSTLVRAYFDGEIVEAVIARIRAERSALADPTDQQNGEET